MWDGLPAGLHSLGDSTPHALQLDHCWLKITKISTLGRGSCAQIPSLDPTGWPATLELVEIETLLSSQSTRCRRGAHFPPFSWKAIRFELVFQKCLYILASNPAVWSTSIDLIYIDVLFSCHALSEGRGPARLAIFWSSFICSLCLLRGTLLGWSRILFWLVFWFVSPSATM